MDSLRPNYKHHLRRFCLGVAFCTVFAGCRSDPQMASHIEMLNAERRALEDQLYELEYDYERKVAEVERLREQLGEGGGASTRRRNTTEPAIELPDSDDDILDLSPPSVTPGTPESPTIELPAPSSNSRLDHRTIQTSPVTTAPTLLQPADPRITHIHIDPLHTGGSDFDQRPGDDGVFVVIEPRNESDRFVPLAGPITVVALDYSRRESGAEPRFARWEISAQQVEHALHNDSSQQGIYLRLPWSDEPPSSSKLMLAVRYTTADGRKLEATRDIFVTLPGQFSQRWTPRSSNDNADQGNSLNVARQPSETDGAQLQQRSSLQQSTPQQIAPVSHVTTPVEPTRAESTPTWRPTR